MTTYNETVKTGEFILKDQEGRLSYDNITVLSGTAAMVPGTVLGKVISGTVATAFAGTGNGAITMDATTPVMPGAKPGDYTATCITAATDGGVFRVEDPDGYVMGDVAVGSTFADDIKFSIADGSTDFTVGAKFTISVSALVTKYTDHDPAATDGSQIAAAVLYGPTEAATADIPAVAVTRATEVKGDLLTWKTGITAAQKAKATIELAAASIIIR